MAIAEKTTQPELKRVLGPKLLLLFVVGDILGTGIYALTGQVAAEVGGAAWVPFLVAFGVAAITACSYLELVTKYPQAAGAAPEAGGVGEAHGQQLTKRRRSRCGAPGRRSNCRFRPAGPGRNLRRRSAARWYQARCGWAR